jgi:hypothetical protein
LDTPIVEAETPPGELSPDDDDDDEDDLKVAAKKATAPPLPSPASVDELVDTLDKSLIIASWNEPTRMETMSSTFLSLMSHDSAPLSLPFLTSCNDEEDGTICTTTTGSDSTDSTDTTAVLDPVFTVVSKKGEKTPSPLTRALCSCLA